MSGLVCDIRKDGCSIDGCSAATSVRRALRGGREKRIGINGRSFATHAKGEKKDRNRKSASHQGAETRRTTILWLTTILMSLLLCELRALSERELTASLVSSSEFANGRREGGSRGKLGPIFCRSPTRESVRISPSNAKRCHSHRGAKHPRWAS